MVMKVENEYGYIFKEYIMYLESILKNDPSNMKAVCQLAIMYLEDLRDLDTCVHLMEDALEKYESCMSKESLCELLNNLAYFYDYYYNDYLRAERTLKRAIELNSNYQNSHYALAYLTAESDPSFAIDIISRISQQENLPVHYKYLFAYILMRNALYEDALRYFEDLMRCDDIELSEKSLYSCAIIYYIIGKEKESSIITDRLYKECKEEKFKEISSYELIFLFYIQQKFERVVELFSIEAENTIFEVHIIKLYLFALKNLGLGAECERVFLNKVDEIKYQIEEIKSDEDCTDSEKLEYIKYNEQNLKILKQNYFDITMKNIIVKVDDIFHYCKAEQVCYLIDCPRHS